MTLLTLLRRSLRHHWRAHLGVVLGAAVGSAALVGALVVGDSVRQSLRARALERLGKSQTALSLTDRYVGADLADRLLKALHALPGNSVVSADAAALLRLPATAARQDGGARANHVQFYGAPEAFWMRFASPEHGLLSADDVVLNEALAAQLHARAGDALVFRVRKPQALASEAVVSPQSDATLALRLRVHSILPPRDLGNLALTADQRPPFNAFVRAETLWSRFGLRREANLVLLGPVVEQSLVAPSGLDILPDLVRRALFGRAEWPPPGTVLTSAEAVRFFNDWLAGHWTLADASLELNVLSNSASVELRSPRIFLDPPVVEAATAGAPDAQPLLTYLVNLLRAGTNTTPYSMVTAAGPPWTPPDLRDDEILVNRWLAEDLSLKPGDTVELNYFLPASGARLMEATNRLRVRGVVPLAGRYADRTLMPEFPGIEKAERTQDWDAGFPLVHKIRDKDEAYWKQHRGTPKAFVSLAAGQKMWANRFGNLTAIRWAVPSDMPPRDFVSQIETSLPRRLKPADLGLRFEPVREQALRAANQAQDFGQLFLGFSFFLIVAALILMALLFQFGLEQRAAEVGTLLALGFTPRGVRRLFLWEGATLAALGGGLGAVGGLAYARAMLHGLTTLWRDAVGVSALGFHVTTTTLVTGFLASVVVGVLAIWLTLRKQARQPARALLAGSSEFQGLAFGSPASRRAVRLGGMALAGASGLVGWAGTRGAAGSAGAFFGAGSLLLIAGLAFAAALLGRLAETERHRRFTLAALGFRGCTRRRNRSLAVTGLLACGSFLIVAIGAFRLDAEREAAARPAGTGGFALIGESSLPVMRDLNTPAGREFYGLDERELAGVSFVPMRVREGDEASCLNLHRAQKPRLLGVQAESLAQRGAFTFAKAARAPHLERADGGADAGGTPGPRSPWRLLQPGTRNPEPGTAEVPAIGDANSIQWALDKKVGEALDYVDEQGRAFKVRLVGAVANSILQGSLLIDEAEFTRRFPGEGGYRFFLIDAPSNRVAEVSAALSRSFQDLGLELTPAPRRLAQFNAVQNTYLNTFQVLGALGLLLGSAGLGVVVLRNVLERRGELALLQAVGFRRRALHRLVLVEHAGLLWAGLGIGLVAALAAILPALLAPGAPVHSGSLAVTVGGVFLSGMLWTWLATRLALRGDLLQALRNE